MSTRIVEFKYITWVINLAIQASDNPHEKPWAKINGDYQYIDFPNAQLVLDILVKGNYAAVEKNTQECYKHSANLKVIPEKFKFIKLSPTVENVGAAFKYLDSLEYNSDNLPDYYNSEVFGIINALRRNLWKALANYKDSEWI